MEVYRDEDLARKLEDIKDGVYREKGVQPPPPGGPAPEFENISAVANLFEQYQEQLRQLERLSNPNTRLPITSHRGQMGRPIVFAKKAVRRLLKPIASTMLHTQEKFNFAIVETLTPFGAWMQNVTERLDKMEQEFLTFSQAVQEGLDQIGQMRAHVRDELALNKLRHDNFSQEVFKGFEKNDRHHQAILEEVRSRISTLEQALDRRLIEVQKQTGPVSQETLDLINKIKSEQNYFRQTLSNLASKAPAQSAAGDNSKDPRAGDENIYYEFENTYRGSQEDIRKRQQMYLNFFTGQKNVLDIGCGRGEFLEVLRENNISARGLDYNLRMVDECVKKGLAVERADCFEFLSKSPDDSFGGIFAAQVIEHLPPNRLPEFFGLCFSKLSAGAPLVLETVNPVSLMTSAVNFHIDLSHQNPLHPETMTFLAKAVGFRNVRIAFSAPHSPEGQLKEIPGGDSAENPLGAAVQQINANIRRLNEIIFGYQDYAVIGYK